MDIRDMLSPIRRTAVTALPLTVPIVALAAMESLDDVKIIIERISNWIFGILVLFSVIVVLYAAFLYLTGSGDPEKLKRANHTLIYAAVAIAIAILATSMPPLIRLIITGSPS